MSKFNLYILGYAFGALLRQKQKSIFTVVVMSLLVFLLGSVLFVANSIRYELQSTVDALPEIIVQKSKASRHYDIESEVTDEILGIAGVSSAVPRVWGYYYFENAKVNFTIMGVNEYDEQNRSSLATSVEMIDFNAKPSMVVGRGVKKVMEQNYYSDYLNFILSNGELKKVFVTGVFKSDSALEANDMIVMSQKDAREIFDMDESMATDIAVRVANANEISTVASKIKELVPNSRVVTKNDIRVSYQNIFDYKSGLFLSMFLIVVFTFFMVVYDRATTMVGESRREIGVLKAVGWKTDDILLEKFYEGVIVSLFSFMAGLMLALAFVYIFHAPLIRDIFSGFSTLKTPFELPFIFDVQTLALLFFISVPFYIGAIIIPSWRSAILDADEVMR